MRATRPQKKTETSAKLAADIAAFQGKIAALKMGERATSDTLTRREVAERSARLHLGTK